MRAHAHHFLDGSLDHRVFRRRPDGLSVDWSQYSSPQDTRGRATSNPQHNAVLLLVVGSVRSISPLIVEHAPVNDTDEPNRAHSLIKNLPSSDPDLTEVRFKLHKSAQIVIPIDSLGTIQ